MNILLNEHIEFSYAGLFSTNESWIHPERTESTYEIICVKHGTVYLSEGDTEYSAKRGQVIILSPNVPHKGTRATSDVEFYWVHFSLKEGSLPFSKRFFESFLNTYLFKELLHYNNLPSVPEYMISAVLTHILAELCRLSENEKGDINSTAEKIYEWIRINTDATLTVEDVSEQFGYSADHVTRICKRYFGAGAQELINRFLTVRAKELLCNTNKYVKEIANELDFKDDKAFIGYFKYHEGCSPTQFRNRFGKIHMNKH